MTSFIAASGSGRSTSVIPALPAASSVTTIAFIRLVIHRATAVPWDRFVGRRLAAAPQPVVERARRHADALGEQLARMDGAGSDLALLAAHPEEGAVVDVGRQRLVVDEDAVAAQHVGDEVVGE